MLRDELIAWAVLVGVLMSALLVLTHKVRVKSRLLDVYDTCEHCAWRMWYYRYTTLRTCSRAYFQAWRHVFCDVWHILQSVSSVRAVLVVALMLVVGG